MIRIIHSFGVWAPSFLAASLSFSPSSIYPPCLYLSLLLLLPMLLLCPAPLFLSSYEARGTGFANTKTER